MTAFPIGAAAAGARVRVIGDAWSPVISFVQSNGQPLDLAGAVVSGEFYVGGSAAPLATLTPLVTDPASGVARYTIPPELTSRAPAADPVNALFFPTRLVGVVVDSAGQRHTDALVLFCPVGAASMGSLPPQDDGVTSTVAIQGPAGPASTPQTVAVTIATLGQTAIPLPVAPQLLSSVALLVNGLAYRAPDIAVTTLAVTWAGPFRLAPSDTVVLTYV